MKGLTSKNFYFILILVWLCFETAQAQEKKAFYPAAGTPADAGKIYDFENFRFSIDKNQFEINKTGRASRTDEKNKVTDFFIKLEKSENLVRIYFSQYKNDLILLCEVETFDAGAGFIVRLDAATLKTKWREHIPGFNVAQGLIENDSAYLAAIGFAAKINLETGRYVWKHDGFYRKYSEDGAFNIFEVPEIEENVVVYTENQNNHNRPPNIIKFDKDTGKVIEVKVN